MTQRLSGPRLIQRVTAVIVVAVLLATPAPVGGWHNGIGFGSTACQDPPNAPRNCISVGNNAVHRVFPNALTTNVRSALVNTINNDYAPTDLTMIVETTYSNRDVDASDGNYGLNGAAGWVDCPGHVAQGTDAHGHRWCQSNLFFNLSYSPNFFSTVQQRDYMTCHELGHTLGLWHNGSSCMQYRTADGNGPTILTNTEHTHLNGEY